MRVCVCVYFHVAFLYSFALLVFITFPALLEVLIMQVLSGAPCHRRPPLPLPAGALGPLASVWTGCSPGLCTALTLELILALLNSIYGFLPSWSSPSPGLLLHLL